MDVGKRIQQRRKDLHMSVDELARQLGKNRATIYRYEKGDIENLPIDILEPLAIALDTSPQYLMGWTDVTESEEINKRLTYQIKRWNKTFEPGSFTDEEYDKLIEYAHFLISQRKEK